MDTAAEVEKSPILSNFKNIPAHLETLLLSLRPRNKPVCISSVPNLPEANPGTRPQVSQRIGHRIMAVQTENCSHGWGRHLHTWQIGDKGTSTS